MVSLISHVDVNEQISILFSLDVEPKLEFPKIHACKGVDL